jgi:MFS family permease
VWADRRSRLYIVGYAVHCWELFGLRSWQVAFFTFAFGVGATQAWLSPTEAAAVLNLLGLPASILGNEMALRWGRRRWIAAMMLSAGVMSWVAGLSAAMPWFLTLAATALYNVMVTADSASLTAGLVANSDPARRGAAMALYSLGGFGAGFVAPVVFGSVLDLTGGHQSVLAWTVSMGVLGAGGLVMGWRLRRTTGVS